MNGKFPPVPPTLGGVDLSKIKEVAPPPRTKTDVYLASCIVSADFRLKDKDTVEYCELSIFDRYFNVAYILRFPPEELQGLMGILDGLEKGIESAKEALNDDAA